MIGLMLFLVGCSSDGEQNTVPATEGAIELKNFAFSPQTISVKLGEEMHFVNTQGTHTVTIADWGVNERLSAGDETTVTANEVGTFTVQCTIHPNMRGTIVVQ